jgi:hypothetical protein
MWSAAKRSTAARVSGVVSGHSPSWTDNGQSVWHAFPMAAPAASPELAFYYGDWTWREELIDWIKTILLFFDGIATALPTKTAEQFIDSDPILAAPLAERGLLTNFEPTQWLGPTPPVDPEAAVVARNLIDAARRVGIALLDDALGRDDDHSQLIRDLLDRSGRVALVNKGGEANRSIRALPGIMTARLLAKNIRTASIQPIIDDQSAVNVPGALLEGLKHRDRTEVITADMRDVGIDLSAVPLDEVLAFRVQYGNEYRVYAKELRRFTLSLSLMTAEDRALALRDRSDEWNIRVEELSKIARRAFYKPTAALAFGLAGGAWTFIHGDPVGAILSSAAAWALFDAPDSVPIGTSYSYILRARAGLARN